MRIGSSEGIGACPTQKGKDVTDEGQATEVKLNTWCSRPWVLIVAGSPGIICGLPYVFTAGWGHPMKTALFCVCTRVRTSVSVQSSLLCLSSGDSHHHSHIKALQSCSSAGQKIIFGPGAVYGGEEFMRVVGSWQHSLSDTCFFSHTKDSPSITLCD